MSSPTSTITPATLEKGNLNLNSNHHNHDNDKPHVPSEGGTKAWLTVAGSSAALFVTFGWVNCIGLFQAQYELNQLSTYTSSQISWITSMECQMPARFQFPLLGVNSRLVFCMLFFSPVGGTLFDSYGPRLPLLIGSIMHVFGLMMLSISSKYYQIMLSQSICSGIGSSLIFSPALTAVSPPSPPPQPPEAIDSQHHKGPDIL